MNDGRLKGVVALRLDRWAKVLVDSGLWKSRFFKLCVVVLLCLVFWLVVTVRLDFYFQGIFGIVAFFISLKIRDLSWGRGGILVLIGISLVAAFRYMYWRITETLDFDSAVGIVFGYTLLVAEIYGFICLLLGYVQTAWPMKRKFAVIDLDLGEWPTVDVFIPTYNESLSVVRLTVLAALTLDWPKDKLRVYLLDDGRRDEFREFAKASGAIYTTRTSNKFAKAGNLNEALKKTEGEFVAIFDCDHIPTRSFLQVTVGSFLKDPKLAMVQTPHFFFSPDPFERNLNTFRVVPNEGELFYGLVQDGNDTWNAAFFCGSCAVLRRTCLEEVGGVAVETVTEDAHTALKMSRKGYNMAYVAMPQAAGLATENLASHVGQRIRWARGMAQIFRIDNPLFGLGLSIGQRLCYLNAMMHFFYGLPRLIFLIAPFAYLFFGAHVFNASTQMVLVFALPPIMLASVTNSKIQGQYRHSFWNEVYETVLAWYITRPVLLALINPKLGKFNVTAKGGIIENEFYDWKIAWPYVLLLVLNFTAIGFCLAELISGTGEKLTACVNGIWVFYNTVILCASAYVANESRQVRHTPRVNAVFPVTLTRLDGRTIVCETTDFSSMGLGLKLPQSSSFKDLQIGERVSLSIFRGDKESAFPASISKAGNTIGIYFDTPLTLDQQKELTKVTFGRADIWAYMWGKSASDSPMKSFNEVFASGVVKLIQLIGKRARPTSAKC